MSASTGPVLSRRDAIKLLAGAGAAAGMLARPRPSRASTPVRLGTIKTPHWAASWLIPDVAKGVQVQLVEFKTSLEMISALTAGNLDVGTIGYWHFIRMLDQGADVTAVAGLCSGGTRLVARPGANIAKWDDLRGKNCAVARGSTQDIQFLLSLKNHGLSMKDINYKDLGGSMAVHITALQQKQTDTSSMWEPFASQVIQQNIATEFSTLYDDSFRVNGLVFCPAAYVEKNRDGLQALIDAHVKATDQLTRNPNEFLEMAMKLSGFPRETMVMANKNSFLEYVLRRDDARKLAAAVQEFGYTKTDVRSKLDTAFDYSFLAKATGKYPRELGA
jgi:ABC-type nitrate/sulfonate/bicarbonate transport system substrate-binding protein